MFRFVFKLLKYTIVVVVSAFVTLMFLVSANPDSNSPQSETTKSAPIIDGPVLTIGPDMEQLKKEQEEKAKKEEAIAKAEAVKKAAERRKGFHCLSAWDGSHRQTVKLIKKNLKDPKSFEHIETRITPVENGSHIVFTKYRAKNSFGGYVVETQPSAISNATCQLLN